MIWVFCKNLSFYFSLYFEASPQQKIPRELYSGEDPVIFLHSHVPMERFFDGMDQENSKKQETKNGVKKKKKFCTYLEVLILVCSQSGKPLCDPPSAEPTCMGTSPTT